MLKDNQIGINFADILSVQSIKLFWKRQELTQKQRKTLSIKVTTKSLNHDNDHNMNKLTQW